MLVKTSRCLLASMLLLGIISCGGGEDASDDKNQQQNTMEQQSQPSSQAQAQSNAKPANKSVEQPATSPSSQPQVEFDLAQVKQQYAGIPLTVLDVSERNKAGKNSIVVSVSVPLDPSVNHQSFLAITDSKENQTVAGQWVLSDSGKQLWFDNTEPSRSYKIDVDTGLTAATGATLAEKQSKTINTRSLRPTATFDTDGHYLMKGIKQGLPIQAVNIDAVNIDFFRIEQSNIEYFLSKINRVYRWNIKRITDLGELVYSGRYDLSAAKNTQVKRQIDISVIDELKPAGVYFAVMTKAGGYDKLQHTWFAVTDLGVHSRLYQNELEVHVNSVTNGKALANIDVSLYRYNQDSRQQELLKTLSTNNEGVASFIGVGKNVAAIVARTDSQLSMVRMRQPQLDLSEFESFLAGAERSQLPVELFIYGPRDLYRPGESIDFSALIRNGDGKLENAPVLKAKIRRPNGAVAHEFDWQSNDLGYYHYNWQMGADAAVGNWSLDVAGPFATHQRYSFKVEEFLPERMKLTFNNGDKKPLRFKASDIIKVPVLGEYLYGAPAAKNRVSTEVMVFPWRNPVKSLPKFEFGSVQDNKATTTTTLPDMTLNNDGQGTLKISGEWTRHSIVKAHFVTSLFESGGRPVTRSYPVQVWPFEQMLGIAPRYQKAPDHNGPKANSVVKFALVKADAAGKKYQANNVKVSLVKLDRNYFWVNDESRGWHYQWTDNEYVEMVKEIDIAADSEALVEFPVEYGNYIVKAQYDGRLISSVKFHAGYDWYASWQDSQNASQAAQPDKITLALDKGAYGAGDIAKVNIVAPHAGQALVMVEGDGPLWQTLVEVSDKGTIVEIPVNSDWNSHNLYISAMIVRPAQKQQAITPKRSFGLIHLPLNRQARKLNLDIDIPETLLPQQKVNAKVKVANADANQVTKVTLAVVDVGVLNITDFATPNPSEHFFGQRRYDVESRDMFDQLIDINNSQLAKFRFGGDADVSRGGKKPQADVQIVSMFYQPVEVVNGVAEFNIQLPDFNGQLRLMAVAFSEDKFGHSEKNTIVAAPVVAEISMPRFLAYQDQSTIALDLHNLSEQAQNLDVQVAVVGQAKLLDNAGFSPTKQQVKLNSGQREVYRYQIESTGINGVAQIIATINGVELDGQQTDLTRQWTLGMRPAYPLILNQQRTTINKGESWQFKPEWVENLIPYTADISFSVVNQVKLPLGSQLKNLLQYPYGCLEQTSSRAYVLTYATDELQKQMNVKPMNNGERIKAIKAGIDRMASLQRSNGGYGLWSSRSPEEHWLTVYVADFLVSAKQMGVTVPDEMYDKTIYRLRDYVRKKNGYSNERYSDDIKNYRFSYRAYAGYVLSRLNQGSLSQLRNIYDKNWDDSATLIGKIHLGLALYKRGDRKRGADGLNKAIKEVENFYRGNKYYGDYGSDIRDLALIVHLMLENKLVEKWAISMGKYIADEIYRKTWLSTQERNALFLAGTSLAKVNGEQWTADLLLNKAKQNVTRTGAYKRLLGADDVSQGLSLTSTAESPLYITTQVSGYTATKPQPVSNKLSIKRKWYNLKGEPINPSSFKSGDLAIIKLTVEAQQRTPDGLIVDLVPAGFEPENQNIGRGIKLNELKIDNQSLDKYINNSRIKYQEYRDDRFVAAVDLAKKRELTVVYLVRAVTPGRYLVPPPFVEDMYAPQYRAIGSSVDNIEVVAH